MKPQANTEVINCANRSPPSQFSTRHVKYTTITSAIYYVIDLLLNFQVYIFYTVPYNPFLDLTSAMILITATDCSIDLLNIEIFPST